MRSIVPTRLHRALLLSAALLLGACLSPTLPLPPPEEPTNISFVDGEEDQWDIRGLATPGSVVLIQNLETGEIFGVEDQDADGRYRVRMTAKACDRAEVMELLNNATSDRTFFIVQPLVNSEPSGNGPDGEVDCTLSPTP